MSLYKKIISYTESKLVHPGVQKYSKNMGWMFFAKIGSMAITFFATAYIARNLGPTNYGELSYAISFVSLFSFISYLGIDPILHRDLIQHPEKRNEILGSAIMLRVIASFFTVGVTMLSAIFISSKDVSLILIFIISLSSLVGAFQLLSYEFQAVAESKYPSILMLLVVIILNILKIITIYFNQGVIYLAGIVLLEPILYSLGYLYFKKTIYNDLHSLSVRKERMFSILRDSFPLIFASAFFLIYSRIDQVMLKNMIGAEAVGLYDSAVRISELSYFIPQLILVSLLPAVVNARKISLELYYKRTKKLLLTIIGISVAVAIGTTIFAKYLLLIIFGGAFIGALPALYICAWSTIGASLNSLAQQILVIENTTKKVSIAAFLGMSTNVLLNLLLIPLYGISGAAFATLVSYGVPFLSLFLFKHTRSMIIGVLRS